MPIDLNSSNLFNPVAFWTDLGLRALDTAVSSSQRMGDGVDRLARVGADAQPADPAPDRPIAPAAGEGARVAADFGLGLALRMQRTTLDLMTQAWQQWLSSLGTIASLGAGRSFRETVERQNPWLNAQRERLVSEADAAEQRATLRGSLPRRHGNGPDREARQTEHAAAAAPRRRGRTAKRATSKSTARPSRGARAGR